MTLGSPPLPPLPPPTSGRCSPVPCQRRAERTTTGGAAALFTAASKRTNREAAETGGRLSLANVSLLLRGTGDPATKAPFESFPQNHCGPTPDQHVAFALLKSMSRGAWWEKPRERSGPAGERAAAPRWTVQRQYMIVRSELRPSATRMTQVSTNKERRRRSNTNHISGGRGFPEAPTRNYFGGNSA